MSFALILPFLKPIAHLIQDPDVSEIMVNGSGHVFVEQQGIVRAVDGVSVADKSLQIAVRNIARLLGDDVSEERPILDARLPDGSRVAAVLPPCSVGGTTLTIRRFQSQFFTVRNSHASARSTPMVEAVRPHRPTGEHLISGGEHRKTTLLNALASFLPEADHCLIEDTAELQLDKPNLIGSNPSRT